MRYGFVIDQDRCIGCHACTVACKEEHQVPVGVFRTWVKHIEKGEFPHTSRHFGVMRCNHCDDSPCTEICPTSALYGRADGIVDFDNRRCIGCKACMQACPYDALYIDPDNNTAAKCNFCAHRVEMNLEPACVDRLSHAGYSRWRPRRSRQQSQPHLWRTRKCRCASRKRARSPSSFMSVSKAIYSSPPGFRGRTRTSLQTGGMEPLKRTLAMQAILRLPWRREVYDVPHPAPWGWKIAAYLWTKAVAAGVLLVAAILLALTGGFAGTLLNIVCPAIALVGLAVTSALLVFDLKRPDRFFYLITKPNFRSWLVIGTYFLIGYGVLAGGWLLCGIFASSVPSALRWFAAAFAIASACYSAFLFAQAKGRDLWQSPLFLWHLLVQALVAGSATILIAGHPMDASPGIIRPAGLILLFR